MAQELPIPYKIGVAPNTDLVLAAKRDLRSGTTIKLADLEWKGVPEFLYVSEQYKTCFRSTQKLVGRTLNRKIHKHELIRLGDTR